MSENEQTGPTGTGRHPQGAHAAADGPGMQTEPSPRALDVPWTPPPRRAQRDRADERAVTPADLAPADLTPGDLGRPAPGDQLETATRAAARRTRAARRSEGTGAARSDADLVLGLAETDPDHGEQGSGSGSGAGTDEAGRRTWVLWAVIGGAVAIVLAAVLAFVLLSEDDAEPAAAAATTTMPEPTPTTDPLDRTGATALVQALPGTVRQFVLASVEPTDTLEGALEAWTTTYTGEVLGEDGRPASSAPSAPDASATDEGTPAPGTPTGSPFTVTVGQWEDAERASAAAQALAAALGEPTSTEDVTVGGEITGTLSYFGSEDPSTGTALWTNGTLVIQASGPATELVNFATAFGL